MRIATYTRISTDEVNQPYSLGAQAERLSAYVASQEEWRQVTSYCDQASGATLKRPGLTKALSEAAAGRYDVLVVYRVDRLCRSVGLLAEVLSRLDGCGVGFRSATEPFETTTPSGRMMMQMLGVFAEFERASIIERVVMGMERKAAQGRWVGGPQPFGFRRAPGGGHLVIEESEAAVVPVIFDLYAVQLLGSHEIARWLNDHGYRTRAGRLWQFKSVLTVLRNRVYLGEVGWRGTWHEAEHEALVEPSVFEATQALLSERGKKPAKRAALSSAYLLTGLVICSCGEHFTGTAATGRHRRYRYYTCGARQRYGTRGCSAKRLPADSLDQAVLAALVELFADGTLVTEALQRSHERAGATTELIKAERQGLDHELSSIEDAIDRYLHSFERGSLPEEVCARRLKELGARANQLRARREELDIKSATEELQAPTNADLAQVRLDLEEALRAGSPAQVKALVHALVHEVRVEPSGAVQPIFKLPLGPGGTSLTQAVREPSRLVEVSGLEPPTSTLRT